MKWKLVIIIAVCVILVAIAATMMLVSGEFNPKEQQEYNVAIILPSTDLHGLYISQSLVGAQKAIKETDSSDKFKKITVDLKILDLSSDETKEKSMKDFESNIYKYDLIYGPSFNTMNDIYYLAEKYPNINYLLMDNTITTDVTNIADIAFMNEEVSFITGYLAGMTTNTNSIGFLGGAESNTIYEFYYGFSAGVKLAEIERETYITILSEYVGDYINQEKAYELTKNMYDSGADVVFTVAGDAGLGGIRAAVDMNKYAIGVDVDQNVIAPNNVLFSAVKNIAGEVNDILTNYAGGDNTTGNIYVGYSDKAFSTVSYIDVVPRAAIENVSILEANITSDNITVPKTAEELANWNVYSAQAALYFTKKSDTTK